LVGRKHRERSHPFGLADGPPGDVNVWLPAKGSSGDLNRRIGVDHSATKRTRPPFISDQSSAIAFHRLFAPRGCSLNIFHSLFHSAAPGDFRQQPVLNFSPILFAHPCRKFSPIPEVVIDERSDRMSVRNVFIGFAGLLLIAMVTVQWTGASVDAQDTTEDRVSALETQVADLTTSNGKHGRDINRLKDRVSALEGGSQPSETGDSGSTDQPAGDSATVSGFGVMVSDKFSLTQGRYKVTATVEAAGFDGFIVHLYGPNGDEEYLFNELIENGGPWTASTIVEVAGGEYAVGVENTGSPWTLVFEKF
jgi:hypothetical protein